MKITPNIRLALHHLKIGVIAHPTDTIYGLACIANNSKAIIVVIIFVIEAGYILISESFSYRILPDKKSCRITVLASIFISAFNNELLNNIKKKNIFMEKFFIYLYLLHLNFQNLVHLNSNKYLS